MEVFEAVSDNPQANLSAVINSTANSLAKVVMSYSTFLDRRSSHFADCRPSWLA